MADQEFLASFGVQIDESGLNRLQKALKDNRTLADDLASSFDKARAAVESFFTDLSEISMDGIASGTGSEDRTGMNLSCPAMKDALDDYVNNRMEIGETLNIPSLYGLLYQSAGAYASTFAVTDLSASGPGGVEHEVLVPAWNEKYVLMSTDDVTYLSSPEYTMPVIRYPGGKDGYGKETAQE